MKFINNIKRYTKLYFILVKNSIMSQMEYRFNFFMACLIQLAYIGVKLTYVIVLYSADVSINGVTPDEMMIFIGTYSALSGIFVSFFLNNFSMLSHQIRTGELDMVIVKPVSLQFMTTLRRTDIGFALVSVITGGAMIIVGWMRAGIQPSVINILVFLGFTISGIFLIYSVFLIPNIFAFWTISTRGINEIVNQMWDFNNMPMIIYNNVIRAIGIFIVPIFIITNFGTLFILNKLSTIMIIWGITAPIAFFIISKKLWNFAVNFYSSASS